MGTMDQTTRARREVVIDLNPDGTFADPPRPPLAARVMQVAVAIAVVAAVMALAAFAFASLLVLIPVAIAAAAVGYGAFRWQVWQQGARRR